MTKKNAVRIILILTITAVGFIGCATTDLSPLENDIASLKAGMAELEQKSDSIEGKLGDFAEKSALNAFVTPEELSPYATLEDLSNIEHTIGELTSAAKTQLNQLISAAEVRLGDLRTEFSSVIQAYVQEDDFTDLAGKVAEIDESLSEIIEVLNGLFSYGEFTSNEEINAFLYGLIDLYTTLDEVERNFYKLKDAMRLFVEE